MEMHKCKIMGILPFLAKIRGENGVLRCEWMSVAYSFVFMIWKVC